MRTVGGTARSRGIKQRRKGGGGQGGVPISWQLGGAERLERVLGGAADRQRVAPEAMKDPLLHCRTVTDLHGDEQVADGRGRSGAPRRRRRRRNRPVVSCADGGEEKDEPRS